jgi:hypothetical protein
MASSSSVVALRGTITVIAAGIAAVGLLSACGSVQDRATDFALERITDGNVEIDRDGNRIVVSGEDGEFVIDAEDGTFTMEGSDGDGSFSIGGTDIPDEWASLLSVFPGATVEAVQSFTGSDGVNQSVSMSTSADASEVMAYYVDIATRAGYTESYRSDTNAGGVQQTMVTFDRSTDGAGSQIAIINTRIDGRTEAIVSLTSSN